MANFKILYNNIANTATVTSTKGVTSPYSLDALSDDKPGTLWKTVSTGLVRITYDFGVATQIKGFSWHNGNNSSTVTGLAIAYSSDDITYTNIKDFSASERQKAQGYHTFDETYRYLRVSWNDSTSIPQCGEIGWYSDNYTFVKNPEYDYSAGYLDESIVNITDYGQIEKEFKYKYWGAELNFRDLSEAQVDEFDENIRESDYVCLIDPHDDTPYYGIITIDRPIRTSGSDDATNYWNLNSTFREAK